MENETIQETIQETTQLENEEVVITRKIDLASFVAEKRAYLEQLEQEEAQLKLRKENILNELESLIK